MSRNVFGWESANVVDSTTADKRVVPSEPSPSVYRAERERERAYGHAAVQCCTVVVLASSDARPAPSLFTPHIPPPPTSRERRCQLVTVLLVIRRGRPNQANLLQGVVGRASSFDDAQRLFVKCRNCELIASRLLLFANNRLVCRRRLYFLSLSDFCLEQFCLNRLTLNRLNIDDSTVGGSVRVINCRSNRFSDFFSVIFSPSFCSLRIRIFGETRRLVSTTDHSRSLSQHDFFVFSLFVESFNLLLLSCFFPPLLHCYMPRLTWNENWRKPEKNTRVPISALTF